MLSSSFKWTFQKYGDFKSATAHLNLLKLFAPEIKKGRQIPHVIILHVPPCGPCGTGTSLHENFLCIAIPSSHLASSIANVGVENCGINQLDASKTVPKCPGHANPLFTPFQTLICWQKFPFSNKSVCHNHCSDVQVLTEWQPYGAICVWQRKLQRRRHLYAEKILSIIAIV